VVLALNDTDQVAAVCRALVVSNSPHWSWGGGSWLFSSYGHTWYNHVHTPNSPLPDCACKANLDSILDGNTSGAHTARSLHRGGVNVAFGDGATRFINGSIELQVWRALGTEAGGETVANF